MGLQLTRGSEYGIRAMLYLAGRDEGEVCSLHDVSSAQDVPESFLAKIFQSLVHGGLVTSHRGAHGGFALAMPAEQITIPMVIEAIDGPISLNQCVVWPETCGNSPHCVVHTVWEQAQKALFEVLGSVSFAELVAEAQEARSAESQGARSPECASV